TTRPGVPTPAPAPGASQPGDEPVLPVIGVVEAKYSSPYPGLVGLQHPWGTTLVVQPSDSIGLYSVRMPDLPKAFVDQAAEMHRGGKQPSAEQLVALAEWALQHRLLDKFTETMGALAKSYKDHPAAVAYQKVQADLARVPTRDDPLASRVREKLLGSAYRSALLDKGHYVLLHQYPDNKVPEVQSRLRHLEETYQTFFYWFAVKSRDGKTPPVPEPRLLAVLVPTKEDQ